MIHACPLLWVCRRIRREADVVRVVRGEADDRARRARAVKPHIGQWQEAEQSEHVVVWATPTQKKAPTGGKSGTNRAF